MTIGIDIDDTLTLLYDLKVKTAQSYISKHNLNFKLVDPDSISFGGMFDWPTSECDKFWFEEADKMLAEAQPREFASEVIKQLKKLGHKIIIVTARTTEWHKEPHKMSYDWLRKNDICYDELLVGCMDKTQACVDKKIDIFIDDLPSTLIKLQNIGIDTILIEAPHNKEQNIYSGKIAKDWREIETFITSNQN